MFFSFSVIQQGNQLNVIAAIAAPKFYDSEIKAMPVAVFDAAFGVDAEPKVVKASLPT